MNICGKSSGNGARFCDREIITVLGAPLGVLAFNLYLNVQFGQPAGYFSPYFQIQTLFFKGIRAEAFPTFPGTTLANSLFGFFNDVPSTESIAVMAALIFLLIMTVEVWARLPRVYGVYMLTVRVVLADRRRFDLAAALRRADVSRPSSRWR